MATADRLREIIVEELGVSPDEVKPESRFIEDLGADSIGLMELVMKLEEEFGLKIPDEDIDKIRTFGDAVKYIEEKLGA
jgi:acyl carrier protein